MFFFSIYFGCEENCFCSARQCYCPGKISGISLFGISKDPNKVALWFDAGVGSVSLVTVELFSSFFSRLLADFVGQIVRGSGHFIPIIFCRPAQFQSD